MASFLELWTVMASPASPTRTVQAPESSGLISMMVRLMFGLRLKPNALARWQGVGRLADPGGDYPPVIVTASTAKVIRLAPE